MANFLVTIIIFYTVLFTLIAVYGGESGTLNIPDFQTALVYVVTEELSTLDYIFNPFHSGISGAANAVYQDWFNAAQDIDPGITDYIKASFAYAGAWVSFIFKLLTLNLELVNDEGVVEGLPFYLKLIILVPLTIVAGYEVFARLFRGAGS